MIRLSRWTQIKAGEGRTFGLAFAYFFCLLGGYFVIRPLRETMGIEGGVRALSWLFLGTFCATIPALLLYGKVASIWPRKKFIPWTYQFFAFNLLAFWLAFHFDLFPGPTLPRVFFIWTSVYTVFVVSVFWSFMADTFPEEAARRLFPAVAAGGTCGAFAGSLIAAGLAERWGSINLLWVPMSLLQLAIVFVWLLGQAGSKPANPQSATKDDLDNETIGGRYFDGLTRIARSNYLLGICAAVMLDKTLATFAYFEQAHIVEAAFANRAERTELFATINLWVQGLTLFFELAIAGRLMRRFGLRAALFVLPTVCLLGFAGLALAPGLIAIVVFQVLRRSSSYGFASPARQVLYTVVDRADRYKAKSAIDTLVFRAADVLGAQFFNFFRATLSLGMGAIATVALPMALLWLWILNRLAQEQSRRAQTSSPKP
ncbi:MAG: MFS transporter [Planctomycetota bacterium]